MSVKREKSDAFMLRFPDRMRDRLKSLAKDNNRSLNAEIIHRLDASLHDGLLFEFAEMENSGPSKSQEKETEENLLHDLLFYEEQLHKVAKALRKLRMDEKGTA